MWTVENRARYNRDRLRYPSDLTDEEWALIEPLIPPGTSGDKRRANLREVVNGLMCRLSPGCQWRLIPKDLRLGSAAHDYFVLWTCELTLDRIPRALCVSCREQAGRDASLAASIVDIQSVKRSEMGGHSLDLHGYEAGKKIKGKKRHILVDALGLLMHDLVHAADIQDRHGRVVVMATLFGLFLFCSSAMLMVVTGAAVPQGAEEGDRLGQCRDRRALRSSQGIRGVAQTLGRGAHVRIARSPSTAGKGIGSASTPARLRQKLATIRPLTRRLCNYSEILRKDSGDRLCTRLNRCI